MSVVQCKSSIVSYRLLPYTVYSLNLKIAQHESHNISEMRQHFCTNFFSFVQKCAALCCIYLTYAKLTETQTSGTNFTKILRIHQVAALF